jgi:hypothetical protein
LILVLIRSVRLYKDTIYLLVVELEMCMCIFISGRVCATPNYFVMILTHAAEEVYLPPLVIYHFICLALLRLDKLVL